MDGAGAVLGAADEAGADGIPGVGTAPASGVGAAALPAVASAAEDELAELPDDQVAATAVPATGPPTRVQPNEIDGPIALIAMSGITVGIPVMHLREVMPHPARLQPLPAGGSQSVGCVALRGQVIPVIDPGRALNLPSDGQPPAIIVILRDGSRAIGLQAQEVRRIVPARDVKRQTLQPARGSFASALPSVALVGDEVISLLDAPALFAGDLPQVVEHAGQSRHLDRSGQFLLCEIGDWRYCVSVSEVEATLAATEVDATVIVQGACEGSIRRHGMEMALLNPRVLTGFANAGKAPKASAGVVLRLDDARSLTLRADRITDILHIQVGKLGPVPTTLCARPDLFQGLTFDAANRPCYVLDLDRLKAEEQVGHLAAVAHPVAGAGQEDGAAEDTGGIPGTAVLLRAGGMHALPIEKVEEIVRAPASLAEAQPRFDGYIGSFPHRNQLLPVFSLAQLSGQRHTPVASRGGIAVVQDAGERIGLMVQELVAIEPVRYIEDGLERTNGASGTIAARASGKSDRLVTVWPLRDQASR